MTTVTQKINTFVLGMSDQPDELKQPGQVVDLKNGIPDVTQGLIKRPGSNLVQDITSQTAHSTTFAVDTGSHTKWFNIYTSNDEQYIGQVSNTGSVKIWRCSDGVPIPVDYADVTGSGKVDYLDNSSLSDEKSSDIQPLTINETTFFCNRRKTVALKTGVSDKSPPAVNEVYIAIDSINYGKQYALDIFDPDDNTTYTYHRATSIGTDEDVSTSNITSYTDDGKCEGQGREVCPPAGSGTNAFTNTGTPVHASSPPNQSASGKANLRYEMDTRCNPITVGQETTQQDDDKWNDSYQPYARLQFGGEGWTTGNTHTFRSTKGLETTVKITNHVVIRSRANIAMVRPEPTSSNNEEMVSMDGILSDLKTTLDGISGTGITTTIVGNGLHLYRNTPFGVTTPEGQLMKIITSEANNISELGSTNRHGYTVRIVNSGDNQDDYYLKFKVEGIEDDIVQTGTYARASAIVTVTATAHGLENGDQVFADFTSGAATDGLYTVSSVATNTFELENNGSSGTISAGETVTFTPARFGEGVWEEVVAPGTETTFDSDTMPVKLTRVLPGTFSINGGGATAYSNGAFRFGYPDWGKRDVGDDITNPKPSFVDHPIQRIKFFRNRIVLLSGENIILSRVNDFYNFWAKTAMTVSNLDPIDLQSSSTYPTKLFDAVETNAGLVVFSASQQFLLSPGAEALLTPETARISYLSSYAFNPDTNPVSLGTTVGFLNSTAKRSRFYEMVNIQAGTEPDLVELSKVVTKRFPENITSVTESTENDMLLFSVDSTLHTGTNEVWGYRWYQQGRKRAQSAWFRWNLSNPIAFHTIMDDVYYAVLQSSADKFTLEKFDLKISDDTLLVGIAPDDNRVHLDTKKTIPYASLTYNSGTDKTTFTLGAGYYSSNTLTAYTTTNGDKAGRSYDVPANKITGTAPNESVELTGNWKYYEKSFATTAVNTTDETITISDHYRSTGDPVTYQEGSSAVGGLTDNTVYYVIKVDDDTIKLATNSSNATAGTAINLTSQGAGTHKLEMQTSLVVGYEYEFEVLLPKIYLSRVEGEKLRSETRGSLIIHRMNFEFGDVGVIDVTLRRKGRVDYNKTYESIELASYSSSTASIVDGYTHTIPIYERNTNLNVYLKSNHPSPATLFSMNWEGDYSPKHYRRA